MGFMSCGWRAAPWLTEMLVLPAELTHVQARACLDLLRKTAAAEREPQVVVDAIHGVQALLRGEALSLLDIDLDMRGVPEFACKVYALTRAIAPGETRTYGELARDLGDVNLSRAVGQALGANPFAPIVPCHRILAAGDKSGGFSAHGGAEQKLRMLAIEGACPGGTLPLF